MRHATRNKQMVLSLLKIPSAYFLIYDEAREREETNEVSGFELHVSCFTWKGDARDREETNEVSGFELHVACFTWKGDARDRDEANEVSVIEVMPRDARESTYDDDRDRHEAKRNGGHMPRDLRGMEVHVLCCYTTKLVSEKMTKANILLSDSLFKISATFWSGYGDKVVITGS